jgi:hypothetical protein
MNGPPDFGWCGREATPCHAMKLRGRVGHSMKQGWGTRVAMLRVCIEWVSLGE